MRLSEVTRFSIHPWRLAELVVPYPFGETWRPRPARSLGTGAPSAASRWVSSRPSMPARLRRDGDRHDVEEPRAGSAVRADAARRRLRGLGAAEPAPGERRSFRLASGAAQSGEVRRRRGARASRSSPAVAFDAYRRGGADRAERLAVAAVLARAAGLAALWPARRAAAGSALAARRAGSPRRGDRACRWRWPKPRFLDRRGRRGRARRGAAALAARAAALALLTLVTDRGQPADRPRCPRSGKPSARRRSRGASRAADPAGRVPNARRGDLCRAAGHSGLGWADIPRDELDLPHARLLGPWHRSQLRLRRGRSLARREPAPPLRPRGGEPASRAPSSGTSSLRFGVAAEDQSPVPGFLRVGGSATQDWDEMPARSPTSGSRRAGGRSRARWPSRRSCPASQGETCCSRPAGVPTAPPPREPPGPREEPRASSPRDRGAAGDLALRPARLLEPSRRVRRRRARWRRFPRSSAYTAVPVPAGRHRIDWRERAAGRRSLPPCGPLAVRDMAAAVLLVSGFRRRHA